MDNTNKHFPLRPLTPDGRTLTADELSLVSGAKMILKTLWTEVTDDPASGTCKNDDHSDNIFT